MGSGWPVTRPARNLAFVPVALPGLFVQLDSQRRRGIGHLMISALGGPERKLANATFEYVEMMALSWSPDGRTLLYATKEGMYALTPQTGEIHPLHKPLACHTAYGPKFSPDGRWIAFGCYFDQNYELDIVPAEGGSAKGVLKVSGFLLPFAWSTDSKRIIFTPNNGDLFEISKDGGQLRSLAFAHDAFQPSISSRGERLAYAQWTRRTNLWRLALSASSGSMTLLGPPNSREQRGPSISPDGTRIAFESLRSGSEEVWVSDLDGANAVQLSNFHSLTGTARWSPDGKTIIFDSRASGESALYLVDPQTAVSKRIPIRGLPPNVPSWSKDGKWIYFRAGTGDEGGLYKVRPGGGDPQLVSPTRGFNIQESKSGPLLLYFMSGETNAAIHVLNPATGVEQPLEGMPKVRTPTDWGVSSESIFADPATSPASIGFFDFASARVTRRMPLPKPPDFWGGIALSPDESWLAYTQVDENESDLMLADGFR